MELCPGVIFDLTRRSTRLALLSLVRSGLIWYCHCDTPCTVWSRARHNITNLVKSRARELVGVELVVCYVGAVRAPQRLGSVMGHRESPL
eukprot:2783860-Heterocapsa_arctica.AAC.1